MDEIHIVEWDHDRGPEWTSINDALSKTTDARIIPVRTELGPGWHAVVASSQTSYREAQAYYDEHSFDGIETDDNEGGVESEE